MVSVNRDDPTAPGPGAVGSSRFTDTIGALAAGATGNCTFKVQVK